MALAGKGVLAFWNGVEPGMESEFHTWHMREHIPERVGVPGFLRARRYVAEKGRPSFFNFYEVETPDVLNSPAYLARLNQPTEWTRSVVRHFTDTSRSICEVIASTGQGDGGYVATVRIGAPADRDAFLTSMAAIVAGLGDDPAVVGAHLLEGRGSGGGTAEKQLRKQPDGTVAWILIVEGQDRDALEQAIRKQFADATATSLGIDLDLGLYRLQFALSKSQLG